MQDSFDLMGLGQGHLLEQGEQLGIPIQYQCVALSHHYTSQHGLHQ